MSENEVVGGSDVPTTDGIYTAEDADRSLRRLEADIRSNPRHAYWDAQHPQQKDWLQYQRDLFKIKHPDQEIVTPVQKAMREAMERQGQEQIDRVQQGEEVMDALVKLGFARASVPPDLTEAEALGLQAQLWAARGQYDEVDRLTKTALEQLPGLPSDVRDLCNDFKDADEDDKPDYVEAIARELVKEWHRKTGFTRRPKGEAND